MKAGSNDLLNLLTVVVNSATLFSLVKASIMQKITFDEPNSDIIEMFINMKT